MNYLAVDSCGAHLTVLVKHKEKLTEFYLDNCNLSHSTVIMQAVEDTLIKAEMKLSDADFFAAAVGPGSFTGIRIGVSTIKGFCFSLNKPALQVTAFDTIAYNIKNQKVLSVIDANHGNFYVCGSEDGKEILSPSFIDITRLKELGNEYKLLSYEKIMGLDTYVVDRVKGLALAIESKKQNLIDAEDLVPLYIRKSQAEENI